MRPRGVVFMEEQKKVTIIRLEQTDVWGLRQEYGQNAFCFKCQLPLGPGDTIVKVRARETWHRPRLYHARCFNNGSQK